MKPSERSRSSIHDRLLAEALLADQGSTVPPVALIEATDRDLLRALRKASPEQRRGLMRLLSRVGARAKRIGEQALALEDLTDDARVRLLEMLAERHKDHPTAAAYGGIGKAVAAARIAEAARLLRALPGPLRATWMRLEGLALLATSEAGMGGLLAAEPDLAEDLLGGLGKDTPKAALETLAALGDRAELRALHKALRSTFFRLAQQGIAVPSLAPAVTPQGEKAPEERAFVSAFDSTGEQAVWILEELKEGGSSVLQAIVRDDGALGDTSARLLVRRGYEALLKGLSAERDMLVAELPVPFAMGLLEEAYALNPAAAGRDYILWRKMRLADRRARRPAPAAASALPEAAEARRLVERSAELLDRACAHWLLGRSDAERALKLVEEGASPLVLPGHEERLRNATTLAAATDAVFPKERTLRYARRLEGTALVLEALTEARLASLARATADALQESPPSSVPFLVAIVERSLEALRELRKNEAAAPGGGSGSGAIGGSGSDRSEPRSRA